MTAHMIWTVSTLPSSASALQSSISALERDITALESQSSGLEPWLGWFTLLVAIGVALEILVVIHDHKKEVSEWLVSELIPKGPSPIKLGIQIASIILIFAGVMGEFGVGLRISSINGKLRSKGMELRSKSDQLLALVTDEAGNAQASAEGAAGAAYRAIGAADTVASKTEAIGKRLERASTLLSEIEHDIRIQGPRWKLLESGKEDFIASLKPFKVQKVTVVQCGRNVAPEPLRVWQELMDFLGNRGAGWDTDGAVWDSCSAGGGTANGGNLITVSSIAGANVRGAATALYEALNKIEVSTVKIEANPPNAAVLRQFLGPGSPWS